MIFKHLLHPFKDGYAYYGKTENINGFDTPVTPVPVFDSDTSCLSYGILLFAKEMRALIEKGLPEAPNSSNIFYHTLLYAIKTSTVDHLRHYVLGENSVHGKDTKQSLDTLTQETLEEINAEITKSTNAQLDSFLIFNNDIANKEASIKETKESIPFILDDMDKLLELYSLLKARTYGGRTTGREAILNPFGELEKLASFIKQVDLIADENFSALMMCDILSMDMGDGSDLIWLNYTNLEEIVEVSEVLLNKENVETLLLNILNHSKEVEDFIATAKLPLQSIFSDTTLKETLYELSKKRPALDEVIEPLLQLVDKSGELYEQIEKRFTQKMELEKDLSIRAFLANWNMMFSDIYYNSTNKRLPNKIKDLLIDKKCLLAADILTFVNNKQVIDVREDEKLSRVVRYRFHPIEPKDEVAGTGNSFSFAHQRQYKKNKPAIKESVKILYANFGDLSFISTNEEGKTVETPMFPEYVVDILKKHFGEDIFNYAKNALPVSLIDLKEYKYMSTDNLLEEVLKTMPMDLLEENKEDAATSIKI